MSEEDLPDAEQFRLEQEHAAREQAEWPRRLEKLCRDAEAHWRAAHPWVADQNMCVSVPIPLGWICRTPKVRGDERRRDNRPPPAE